MGIARNRNAEDAHLVKFEKLCKMCYNSCISKYKLYKNNFLGGNNMSLLKDIQVKAIAKINSDKEGYGEGIFLVRIQSMKVFNTILRGIYIPEPDKREIIHRVDSKNTFCSDTIGAYPEFLDESEIRKALCGTHGKRFLVHVYENSITVFMSNFSDEGPITEFLKNAQFKLQKNGVLVLS